MNIIGPLILGQHNESDLKSMVAESTGRSHEYHPHKSPLRGNENHITYTGRIAINFYIANESESQLSGQVLHGTFD